MISRQTVADALTRFDRLEETNTELTRAAVTLFITRTTEHAGLGILLTRRAATLRRHAGGVSSATGRAWSNMRPGRLVIGHRGHLHRGGTLVHGMTPAKEGSDQLDQLDQLAAVT